MDRAPERGNPAHLHASASKRRAAVWGSAFYDVAALFGLTSLWNKLSDNQQSTGETAAAPVGERQDQPKWLSVWCADVHVTKAVPHSEIWEIKFTSFRHHHTKARDLPKRDHKHLSEAGHKCAKH